METATQPVTSTAVAEHLGPPWIYHRERGKFLDVSDALRQIELAEAKLKFGSSDAEIALEHFNFERVLQQMPGDLPLQCVAE